MQRLAEYLGGELLNAYGSDTLSQLNRVSGCLGCHACYFSIIVPCEHALSHVGALYSVLLSKLIEFVRRTYHVGIRIFFQSQCA